MKILFLCVANSARSQIAEGLAKHIFGDTAEIHSAGSHPSGVVQPLAIEVLKEVGIDISKSYSKFFGDLPQEFLDNLDFVITLCAEEACPTLSSKKAKKLHWPIQDPVSALDHEKLNAFRISRDLIRERLTEWKNKN